MRVVICSFILFSCFWNLADGQEVSSLPGKIAAEYVTESDPSISDEFDEQNLDTKKWGRRHSRPDQVGRFADDETLVVMESEKSDGQTVGFVSIKGTAKNGPPRTAGICTKASGHFGFYVVRFRYQGFDSPETKKKKTVWHPSVWSANTNHAKKEDMRVCSKGPFWLEIDLMEWETFKHGWSSDAPARLMDSSGKRRKVVTKGPDAEKAIMKDEVSISDDRWQTVGLEYHPDYLKLWVWDDGKWKNYSDREVRFVEEDPRKPEASYTLTSIGKRAAQPCFWVLGNVISPYLMPRIKDGTIKQTMDDMTFDVDYFRYYRHKSVQDGGWMWENQMRNGG